MNSNIGIDVNLGGVPTMLNRLAQMHGYKTGLMAGGTYIKGRVAQYPSASHRPQRFVSNEHRRGFFGKLRRGDIEVPYKRGMSPGSEKLGQSWNVEASANGMVVTVGTAASYAKLVQGQPGEQAGYHAGTGWRRIDEVAQQDGPQAVRIVEDNVKRMTDGG